MRDGRDPGVHGPGGHQDDVLHRRHGHVEFGVMGIFIKYKKHVLWLFSVLIYMLVTGGTSPFWAGTNVKTQRKILKAKFTMKLKAFEVLSAQIKQLIKR